MGSIPLPNTDEDTRPTAPLCWESAPVDSANPMVHCDRKLGHRGRHSWAEPAWQPVNDSDRMGIVSDGDYVCAAYRDSMGIWVAFGGGMLKPQPTHWQPLPASPKENT